MTCVSLPKKEGTERVKNFLVPICEGEVPQRTVKRNKLTAQWQIIVLFDVETVGEPHRKG